MFRDRDDAARLLAKKLAHWRGRKDVLVLAVPRGGLPIGAVLARELGLRLDVILTKKIGHPSNPEFAIGAVSLAGESIDERTVARDAISPAYIAQEIALIRETLEKRYRMYCGAARPAPVAGKTVILTDDGAATGRTLLVAVDLLRGQGAARIVVALPVASEDAVAALRACADEVVCLEIPADFMAIGQFYADFSQVPDEEAVALLRA
jgi:predicted phosphoribosyltransferase